MPVSIRATCSPRRLDIPDAKYATPERRNQFFDRVVQSVRALPGVQSAAWIDTVPLQGGSTQYVAVEGQPVKQESEQPVVAVRLPSPDYFKTARTALLAGRDFTDADGYGKPGRRDRQRTHRAAVLAESESAGQAHHADDDVEGGRRKSSASCAR